MLCHAMLGVLEKLRDELSTLRASYAVLEVLPPHLCLLCSARDTGGSVQVCQSMN